MVANGNDAMSGWLGRGIGTPTPSDSNGVDGYRHLFYNEGWGLFDARGLGLVAGEAGWGMPLKNVKQEGPYVRRP